MLVVTEREETTVGAKSQRFSALEQFLEIKNQSSVDTHLFVILPWTKQKIYITKHLWCLNDLSLDVLRAKNHGL